MFFILKTIRRAIIAALSGNEMKNKLLRQCVYHIGKNTSLQGTHFGAEPWLLWIGDNVIAAVETMFSFWTDKEKPAGI